MSAVETTTEQDAAEMAAAILATKPRVVLMQQVIRRNLADYFDTCAIDSDPASIAQIEFQEVAEDICAAWHGAHLVGDVTDLDGVDTAFLEACLARARSVIAPHVAW